MSSTLNLLETYPKAAIVVKQWFLDRMLESLNDESIPDDFKEHVRKQGIDNEKVADILGNNPRALFTPLDLQDVYIEIIVKIQNEKASFSWSVNKNDCGKWYNDRISAEKDAMEEAFKVLNSKL